MNRLERRITGPDPVFDREGNVVDLIIAIDLHGQPVRFSTWRKSQGKPIEDPEDNEIEGKTK